MNSRSVLECGSPLPLFLGQATSSVPPESARGLAQSKTWRSFFAAFTVALLFVSTTAHAQTNYAIPWFKIAGGGGMQSTGGVYALSGTIGQPDASGPMTNAPYAVTGGFWSLYAVQTTNAPTLTIVPATPGNATISWTPSTTNFVLQENLNLGTTNWVNSPSGTNNPVVVPATVPKKFYRLFKP